MAPTPLLPSADDFNDAPDFDQQVDDIATALNLLARGYRWLELRALHPSLRPVSGCFNNPLDAAKQAAVLDLDGYGVFFGINPLDFPMMPPPLRLNVFGQGAAASDSQIVDRRRLLIDVDPVRPPGCCSTDAEKAAAYGAAMNLVSYLRGAGWPDPIIADSGNGNHILYKVDLPTDDGGLVHTVLQAIADRFNSTDVKFDTTVGNAARVCRLYGTHNRKGPFTEDRPHRMAKILSTPVKWKFVPDALLESLAATASTPITPRAHATAKASLHEGSPCIVTEPQPHEDLIARARAKLHTLPIAVEGADGSKRCFHAACVLAIDFGLTEQEAFELLKEYGDRCLPPWPEDQLRHKLRDALKKAQEKPEDVGGSRPEHDDSRNPAERLMKIVKARVTLWHDSKDQEPYASAWMPTKAAGAVSQKRTWHRENHRIHSTGYSELLRYIDFSAHGRVAPAQALREAIETCASIAKFEGSGHDARLRVARSADVVHLDLGTEEWNAVEVDANGWRVVADVPCKFRRSQGMLPLPTPLKGGTITEFQELFSIESQADLLLLLGWLTMAFHGRGPFPVLNLVGEQGTAKTTTAEMIRSLVDPAQAGIRSLSKDEGDLMIAADNMWIVAFDNLSGLSAATSDSLCRLSTGGANATRKLYTNREEALFQACRPAILTGISEVSKRADLLDRSVVLQLPVIDEEKRRSLQEVKERYDVLRPRILGLLLDGVASALANYQHLNLDARLRMADFQQWAAAAMPAFGWAPKDFLEAYAHNVDVANGVALEDTPVVPALRMLLKARGGRWPQVGEIKGARALLQDLESLPGTSFRSERGWPQKYNVLGDILRRLAPVFRRSGLRITFSTRLTTGERITPIEIEMINAPKLASLSVPTNPCVDTTSTGDQLSPPPRRIKPESSSAGENDTERWLAAKGY